ncbi:MAG: glutaredoxin domain-containing protein [Pseudomonadota bacterium]
MKKIISIVLALIIALFALYQFGVNRYIPESGATDIVIYTTDWCPYCKTLRKTLDKYQIPYAEYDTEKSIDGMLGYLALGGRGVPVVVVGENIIYGYDGIEITDALADAGYELPLDWGSEY